MRNGKKHFNCIQNLNFIIHRKCYYSIVYGIVIKWQAINDERIQVINEFNMISFENKTYSHINPNVEEALISLINFSYKDCLINKIQCICCNNQSKQQIIKSFSDGILSNFRSQRSYSQFSTINKIAVYISPHYNFKDSSLLITPFIGISYDLTDNFRLNKTYYTNQQAIWYQIHTLLNEQYCTAQNHKPAWLKYKFIVKLSICPATQIFNTQDTFSIILDQSHELISRKIYAKSFTNKSIQSYLNKCNERLQSQQHQFKHNCYGAINTINFSIKLFPTTQAHQELIKCIKYYTIMRNEVKVIDIKQIDTQL
ncbi:unnamed protein product [Paramecium primaurelia]|uniref:Uncharacterized protein n=1 Tax=Paramecium primaurelia TaxID=5886 RepID=A0A8S1P0L7_PARPR|nr:unnamed protein product [Paramecium primaurelia]